MLKNKKAQAALEFLTTYGWAILVVMLMIGALSYFGVLNPGALLPDRCNFPSEFICQDFFLDGVNYEVQLRMRQNVGKTIIMENMTCIFPDSSTAVASPTSIAWSPKQILNVTCSGVGTPLISGDKQKVNIELIYRLDSAGYEHFADGEVYANVR